MPSGSYTIYKPPPANSNYNFWKSATCSLLILIVLSLIIIFATWSFKDKKETKDDFELDVRNSEELYQNEQKKNSKFEQIKLGTILTTTDKGLKNSIEHNTEQEERITKYHELSTLPESTNIDEDSKSNASEPIGEFPLFKEGGENDNLTYTSNVNAVDKDTTVMTTSEIVTESSAKRLKNYHLDSSIIKPLSEATTTETSILTTIISVNSVTPYDERIIFSSEATPFTNISQKGDEISENIKYSTTPSNNNYYSSTPPCNANNLISNKTFWQQICQRRLEEEQKVCSSSSCKMISSEMLAFMNEDQNPCHDFYRYACEGGTRSFVKEKDSSNEAWKRVQEMIKTIDGHKENYLIQFTNYYKSCMDYNILDAVNKVKTIISSVGSFRGDHDGTENIPTLTYLLTQLLMKNFAALFDIKLEIIPKTKNLTFVILPMYHEDILQSLTKENKFSKHCLEQSFIQGGIADLNYAYTVYESCQANKSSYIIDMTQALHNFGVFESFQDADKTKFIKEIMISFELNILTIQKQKLPPKAERKKILSKKATSTISFGDLKKELPKIAWDTIFYELFEISVSDDFPVQVYFFEYLKELIKCVVESPVMDQNNNILAMFAYKLYKDYILDHVNMCDRSLYCTELSSNLMPDVSSMLYLNSFTDEEIKKKNEFAQDLFLKIKNTLTSEIIADKWLSNPSNPIDKKNALDLLKNLKLFSIGNNLLLNNEPKLLERFNMIEMIPDDFINNTVKLEQHYRKFLYSKYDTDPISPQNLWTNIALPYEAKVFNILPIEGIVLPLAAIPDMVNSGVPTYIEISELGFQMAKQINLCLEIRGIQVLREMDVSTKTAQIKIDNTIEGGPFTVKVDPELSIVERITDIAAAQLVYLTYKKSETINTSNDLPLIWQNKKTDQLYFLHLMQQFCTKKPIRDDLLMLFEDTKFPAMFAVNNIVANSINFTTAYSCSSEDEMVAAIKIPLIIQNDDYSTDTDMVTEVI